MKRLLFCGLALSLSAFGIDYAPNDGSAKPGNPGTYKTKKAGPVVNSGTGTNIQTGNADPNVEVNENLERSNTSPNPIPEDTTLRGSGSTQTGKNKQSQETTEEELDYRTKPTVDHTDQNASENQ